MNRVAQASQTTPVAGDERWRERFILLGEAFDIHRGHARASGVQVTSEPRSADSCRVVRQRDIGAYRLTDRDLWAEYGEIREALRLARAAGGTSHIAAFPEAAVFAPLKLVLAERDRPIRAAIAYEPVYPARGKLLTLRLQPDLAQSLHGSWMAYAAMAVLNSALGQAIYLERLRLTDGRASTPSGLSHDVLEQMPIAARHHSNAQLRVVVSLAYQVATLHEAEAECQASFYTQIMGLRERLGWETCALLGLGEPEARRLLSSVSDLELPDLPRQDAQLEIPGIYASEPPPLPPVRLFDESAKKRPESFRGRNGQGELLAFERPEIEGLKRLAYWEDVVNAVPPAEMRLGKWLAGDSPGGEPVQRSGSKRVSVSGTTAVTGTPA